jgi:hypothetical protein
MENPDNEDIIIPVCILLIVAGIQQYIAVPHFFIHINISTIQPVYKRDRTTMKKSCVG